MKTCSEHAVLLLQSWEECGCCLSPTPPGPTAGAGRVRQARMLLKSLPPRKPSQRQAQPPAPRPSPLTRCPWGSSVHGGQRCGPEPIWTHPRGCPQLPELGQEGPPDVCCPAVLQGVTGGLGQGPASRRSCVGGQALTCSRLVTLSKLPGASGSCLKNGAHCPSLCKWVKGSCWCA